MMSGALSSTLVFYDKKTQHDQDVTNDTLNTQNQEYANATKNIIVAYLPSISFVRNKVQVVRASIL